MNFNNLKKIRHQLHQQPELSGFEEETAKLVASYLSKCRPTQVLEHLGGCGLLAEFDSGQAGPAILFRAELDALPIDEVNTFDHRSHNPGVSHKCGHDGHTTILLSIAQSLSQNPINKGKLYLLFQPAEETGAGAKAVLKDPRMQGFQADYVFALHNLPAYALHQVCCKPGAITPAVKSIIFKLKGAPAHAAEPENGINPALAIAEILKLNQSLVNLDKQSSNFFLSTPIYVNIGEKAYGVAASAGEAHFTIRAHTNQNLKQKEEELILGIRQIAAVHQLDLAIEFTDEFQSNDNHREAFAIIKQAAKLVNLTFHELDQSLSWGEDFGLFTAKYPGALFGLGAGIAHPALHQADYDFPDELLESGFAIFNAILNNTLR